MARRVKAMAETVATLLELQEAVKKFVDTRDWNRYHNPKDLAISIAIESAELLEIFQWKSEASLKNGANEILRNRVAEELADIIIYCANLANIVDLDLGIAVSRKLTVNEAKYPAEKVRDSRKWEDVIQKRG